MCKIFNILAEAAYFRVNRACSFIREMCKKAPAFGPQRPSLESGAFRTIQVFFTLTFLSFALECVLLPGYFILP